MNDSKTGHPFKIKESERRSTHCRSSDDSLVADKVSHPCPLPAPLNEPKRKGAASSEAAPRPADESAWRDVDEDWVIVQISSSAIRRVRTASSIRQSL